jgi:hypothetical protein
MSKATNIVLSVILAVLVVNTISGWLVLPLWEYRIVGIEDDKFDVDMKTYGNAGWELVVARRAVVNDAKRNSAGELLKTPETRGVYECIFKRRLTILTGLERLASKPT